MAFDTLTRPSGECNASTPFNLLRESWLPIRRRDGSRALVSPAQIGDPSIVDVDWPRADFRVASLELLIGLLATACPPTDEDTWFEGWENPPPLAAAFAPLEHAFGLDGDGPRFMQDFDAGLEGEQLPVETLLVEAPGAKTRTDNATLFVKADRVSMMSRAAAAISLYTLQTYAPSGGCGIRTSLRGGGPLTTLVQPGGEPTLWQLLWANVPQGKRPSANELPLIFPWLAPTRDANNYPVTTPVDAAVHSLQAFWGLPRRIRLEFTANADSQPCGLTGAVDPIRVTGWRQRPNGVNYQTWVHPLSPYYHHKSQWLPVHPQPGGIGYRHWVGLVVSDAAGTLRPAANIVAWQARKADLPPETRDARVFAAGYDCKNMKARSFVESEMPLPGADVATMQSIAFLARHLIAAAEIVATELRYRVRDARSPIATTVYEAFWTATQADFWQALRDAPRDAPQTAGGEQALAQAAPAWLRSLRNAALALFDTAAPLDPSVESFDPGLIIKPRRQLGFALSGYGATGKKLFGSLLLPAPISKSKK